MTTGPGDVTALLQRWQAGDDSARDRLLPLVYDQLHALAQRYLGRERQGHTLQPTALVNEAYLRLAGGQLGARDRTHFLAIAATVTRRVLIDHARAHRAERRGGGVTALNIDDVWASSEVDFDQLLEMNRLLDQLAAKDPRKAEILEMLYFGGLTSEEAAGLLDISESTLYRELRFAKAWIAKRLHPPAP